MEKYKNQRLAFALPEENTIVKVIFEILKNNGLEETRRESYLKSTQGKDSRLIIVRDAAVVMAQKKIPEEKVVELLVKHLETSKENVEKIVVEIKQKLIPYAKIIDLDEQKKKEGVLEKIAEPGVVIQLKEAKALPFVKKVETKNVEENAKQMEDNLTNEKKEIELKKVKTVLPQEEKKGPDDYREPIE